MLEIKLLPGSEVEITGEIPTEEFEDYKKIKILDENRVKVYTYGVIRNQKVIKFLETC